MSQGRSVVSLAVQQERGNEPQRPAAMHRADTRFLTHLLAVKAQLPSQRPAVLPLRLDRRA